MEYLHRCFFNRPGNNIVLRWQWHAPSSAKVCFFCVCVWNLQCNGFQQKKAREPTDASLMVLLAFFFFVCVTQQHRNETRGPPQSVNHNPCAHKPAGENDCAEWMIAAYLTAGGLVRNSWKRFNLVQPRGDNTRMFLCIIFILCVEGGCVPGLGYKWEDFSSVHITVRRPAPPCAGNPALVLRIGRSSAGKLLTNICENICGKRERERRLINSWLRKEQCSWPDGCISLICSSYQLIKHKILLSTVFSLRSL